MPYTTGNPDADAQIQELLTSWGVEQDRHDFAEMLTTLYKLAHQNPARADVILWNRALKEMRYAQKIFAPYRGIKKICVFGSARTQPSSPEYKTAMEFARLMRDAGYMMITGAGDGIMGAAQTGAGKERSFGLNIRLPFEQDPNQTILGDPKLITFRYFFTRKLTFVKEAHAIALLPGGFGTMDEGFEALTLLQTGKRNLIPVILLDAPGGNFWHTFERYLREHLLRDGMISEADFHLLKITDDIQVAAREIFNFYYNFHSYRFVRGQLVVRLQREVPPGAIPRLRMDFADMLAQEGELHTCPTQEEEVDEPEISHLPRLCLKFDKRSFGRLRLLIDRLNEF